MMGLSIGFRWTYGGDGNSSRTSAVLASYHHPRSITWRWALTWERDTTRRMFARVYRHSHGWARFSLPYVGGFRLAWQPHMMRAA